MAAINSVNNLDTDLRAIVGSIANETVEVLGYYAPGDGGGGNFYWDIASTATDNGGTIIQPTGLTTGRWVRNFDNIVDVKWFGCKGDDVTDDTINFQNALTFVSAQPVAYSVYISRGTYRILAPGSGNDCLYLDLTGGNNCNVYGDGPTISVLRYDRNSSTTVNNVLRIKGTIGYVNSVEDFSITTIEEAGHKYGKGLVLEMMYNVKVQNIRTFWMDTGIELIDILTSSMHNVLLLWGKTGLNAYYSNYSSPKCLNFTSCSFGANELLGVKMDTVYGLQSVTFTSCSIENNGTHGDPTTGGISAFFTGIDGAQGLNVQNCYFEGNRGGFDINLLCHAYGSHTFTGNNFNRISNTFYTDHNIVIDSNGQTPQPDFGFGKVKLTFIGNGFKTANSYVPSASRRTIELVNGATDYWQYDVTEEGNTYISPIEAPDFNKKTPQISEFTRVKAFGIVEERISVWTVINGYNVASCTRISTGLFRIDLANDLGRDVIVNITPHNTTGIVIANVTAQSSNLFVVSFNDLSGGFLDTFFNFTVF